MASAASRNGLPNKRTHFSRMKFLQYSFSFSGERSEVISISSESCIDPHCAVIKYVVISFHCGVLTSRHQPRNSKKTVCRFTAELKEKRMTFQILRYHKPGEVASFVGTRGQRAANLLSHKWEEFIPQNLQMPSHLRTFEEKRTYLDNSTFPDDLKTPALRCAVCGASRGRDNSKYGKDNAIYWPCGEPRIVQEGEKVWDSSRSNIRPKSL